MRKLATLRIRVKRCCYAHTVSWCLLFCLSCLFISNATAQRLEFGTQYTFGYSYASFNGNLSDVVGFDEIEITSGQVDTAFTNFNLSAPKWLKSLFPGIRLDVDQDITKQLSRPTNAVRFFARYGWIGGSFMISEPRLTEKAAATTIGNRWKSIRLGMQGDALGLSEHLGELALEDAGKVEPFFEKRYDLEFYVHAKKLLFGERPLLTWGEQGSLDVEVTTGLRLTADPSPIVELGSILFISEKIDSLMEGRLLDPVEDLTDEIAVALQSTVFGKFKDPRVISSLGWFARVEAPVHLAWGFSVVLGGEFGFNDQLLLNDSKPIFSTTGYLGIRWSGKGSAK